MQNTLIDAPTLFVRLGAPDLRIVDCRFSLMDSAAGPRAYAQGHLPGATYAHLNDELSGPVIAGKTGRHPLPEIGAFAEFLGRSGISNQHVVVAYDAADGSMAARLWWLLRYLGHDRVLVLDGGFGAWRALGYPISTEPVRPAQARFEPHPRERWVVTADEVEALRKRTDHRLLDARAPERFRGEQEPIDPVAGHIPGARSLPFAGNLAEGRFLPPAELRDRFLAILGDVPPERAVVYCGSGVTASHHVLAAEHAGLSGVRLYAGSWSEWITSGDRPIETGGG